MKYLPFPVVVLSTLLAMPAYAACQSDAVEYDFPAQRMDEALQQLAHRSGCFINTDLTRIADEQAPALSGTYRPEEALWELLKGSGWEGYLNDEGLEVSEREQAWVKART